MVGFVCAPLSGLAQLPPDVVFMIVRQVYAAQTGLDGASRTSAVRRNVVRRIARALAVAGVSRTWRQAAVPFVYGTVACEQADGRWRTNAKLCARAAPQWARQLVVVGDGRQARRVLELAGFGRARWPRLQRVQVVGHEAAAVCALVTCDRLALPRAGACSVRVAPAEVCELTLPWNAHSLAVLRAAAASVEQVRLLDIPHARSVLQLQARFPRVRALSLLFADLRADANAASPRDRRALSPFPRLQRLRASGVSFDMRELLQALCGAHTSRVELEVGAEQLASSRLLALDLARQAPGIRAIDVACVGPAHVTADCAAALARQVVRTAPAHLQHLRLSIRACAALPRALFDSLSVRCTQLRTLELRVPVRLADCESLVARLPRLERLRVPYVCTDELPANEVRTLDKLYVVMSKRQSRVLSASLQALHVGFWDYRQPTRALCCHVIHLAARLPGLLLVSADPQFSIALRSAVDGLHLMRQRHARWSSADSTDWLDHLIAATIRPHA
ncbi:hypothetical protein LPJ63_004714 [Coemansia sp. RSA 2711]|nr:hypothetical protein LPJ63_004714 [Coemansia sp. RSA 2711]